MENHFYLPAVVSAAKAGGPRLAYPFRQGYMTDKLRNSGIHALGALPWGTHICQFYESKDDLLDVLVPWFVEGLRGGELCVWIVSEPPSPPSPLSYITL